MSLLVHENSPFIRWLITVTQLDIDCLTIATTAGAPRLAASKLDFYRRAEAQPEFLEIERVFKRLHPTLVVSDAFPIIPLVCEKLGILHASLASASWTNYYLPERPSPQFDWIGQLMGDPFRDLLHEFTTALLNRQLTMWAKPLNLLARSLGLRERRNIPAYMEGNDLTLITDAPEVGPLTNPPQSFKYCGPISWYPPFHSAELLSGLGSRRERIYLSFGSSGEWGIAADIVRWLLKEDYEVIVAGSGWNQMPQEIIQQANCRGAGLINPWDVIPTCHGVIFHGGVGTAYQALACEKPSIVIPSHIEQYWNGYRLERIGVSALLNPQMLSRGRLIATVRRMLGDKEMRERVTGISAQIRGVDGARNCVDMIVEAVA